MTKDSLRKCSHCGHNGHNSRTCNNGKVCSFKLFGVRIDPNNLKEDDQSSLRKTSIIIGNKGDDSMRKSKSMGNLQTCSSSNVEPNSVDHGYLSDGLLQSKETHDHRKKGVPWTPDEHRAFLVGLKKLGKGYWRGISKKYVPTRTPTQVASHAQKYFIRLNAVEKRKRRSSLFDIPLKESTETQTSSELPSTQVPDISLQLGKTRISPLNNTSNVQVQVSTSAPVATSERPPLSPMARAYGIPDFPCMPSYMVGYPSNGQSFAAAKCMPAVSFVPMTNYMYQPSGHGSFPISAPFMTQPMSDLFPKPLLPNGSSSQAAIQNAVTTKDHLEAGIGALTL